MPINRSKFVGFFAATRLMFCRLFFVRFLQGQKSLVSYESG